MVNGKPLILAEIVGPEKDLLQSSARNMLKNIKSEIDLKMVCVSVEVGRGGKG